MKKLTADAMHINMQLAVFIGLLFCIVSLALLVFFTFNHLEIPNEDISLWDLRLILVFFCAGVACLIYRAILWIIIHYSKIEPEEE